MNNIQIQEDLIACHKTLSTLCRHLQLAKGSKNVPETFDQVTKLIKQTCEPVFNYNEKTILKKITQEIDNWEFIVNDTLLTISKNQIPITTTATLQNLQNILIAFKIRAYKEMKQELVPEHYIKTDLFTHTKTHRKSRNEKLWQSNINRLNILCAKIPPYLLNNLNILCAKIPPYLLNNFGKETKND